MDWDDFEAVEKLHEALNRKFSEEVGPVAGFVSKVLGLHRYDPCTNCSEAPLSHRVDGRCVYSASKLHVPIMDTLTNVYEREILPHHYMYWCHDAFSVDMFKWTSKLPPPLVYNEKLDRTCSVEAAACILKGALWVSDDTRTPAVITRQHFGALRNMYYALDLPALGVWA